MARSRHARGRLRRARSLSARSIRSGATGTIEGYAKAGLQALAMEWMPRITRAQSMDILSSQSNLAGYKAVIDAAAHMAGNADDDDRRGHDQPGPGVRDGRRRRRAAGDRDRQAPRRPGQRDRRPFGDEGTDPVARRQADLRRERRRHRGRGGRAAMRPRCPTSIARRRPSWFPPHRQAGHRHHHRADPGKPAPR
jgi:hypothetical protein